MGHIHFCTTLEGMNLTNIVNANAWGFMSLCVCLLLNHVKIIEAIGMKF